MKFKRTEVTREKLVLANDHFVSIPYNCSAVTANSDGVIPAGTVIPTNDAKAIGILLTDVVPTENPNGTIVIHGFIEKVKLPVEPTTDAETALKQITFLSGSQSMVGGGTENLDGDVDDDF